LALLLVIEGPDQGKRIESRGRSIITLGRDASSAMQVHDGEVSRRHAELRPLPSGEGYALIDLGSANGTLLNGRAVDESILRSGDQIKIGQSVILFTDQASPRARIQTARVEMLAPSSPDDRSAIIRSIPADEGSRVLEAPELAGPWLKERLAHLAVMYRAIQATSHVTDLDHLLNQILTLVFDTIAADRGVILLRDRSGALSPRSVRWRGHDSDPDERLAVSRTITDYVLTQGQGVITTDAPTDERFARSESIVDFAIREAVCVPLQARHGTLGVLYADVRAPLGTYRDAGAAGSRHFTPDHLMLMVALGTQAGLAIENTQLHHAKVEAERLAAVGQTIANLSHHIKNILQGLKGGSFLIDSGLGSRDEEVVRRGWAVVEKNQNKIYNLVLDMLSLSKEREPAFEPGDLNQTLSEVVELMRPRAGELGISLETRLVPDIPRFAYDAEGIHRAILNIVTNALDACEGLEGARVLVCSELDPGAFAHVIVSDTGPGIPPEEHESIFEVYASSKGSRGTGLGLPVSRKIAREHGGELRVVSTTGEGARFALQLPLRPLETATGNHATLGEGDPSFESREA
jgi:signal transduction histidine kinase